MEKISLISRVRAGDRKAFDELCRKYYAMLVSYARLFLRDDWAEDVVQDVFYNVWQRRETLDDSNSLYKYLLRSVYNRSLNYLDKNRRAGEYGATTGSALPRWAVRTMHPTTAPSCRNSTTTTCAPASMRPSSRCRPNAAKCSV